MAAPSDKFYAARIVERREISSDLWTIRVDPGGEFKFRAGQYATLGVESPHKLHERPYSIVSAPHEKLLEFFFELVPKGEVTPLLYAAGVGNEITLRKAARGTFTLDLDGGYANHFLIGTVTGVAPYVSFLRTILQQQTSAGAALAPKLFVLDGASRSWELGYAEEMERAAREVSWLKYVSTVSRPWEDEKWSGETGRVDDVVRKYADVWKLSPRDTKVYLCGHPGMIENVRGIAVRGGWKDKDVQAEAFFVPARNATSARA